MSSSSEAKPISRSLKILVIICMTVGCALRFYNLERMSLWDDEADSILHASGHSIKEAAELYRSDPNRTAAQLLKLQKFDAEHGLLDVFKNFKAEDPQHLPLFYMLTNLWMHVFGDTTLSLRALPALLSLLLIPLSYMLGFGIFRDRNAGWIGALFASVSPFEFVYAREVREYVSTYFF